MDLPYDRNFNFYWFSMFALRSVKIEKLIICNTNVKNSKYRSAGQSFVKSHASQHGMETLTSSKFWMLWKNTLCNMGAGFKIQSSLNMGVFFVKMSSIQYNLSIGKFPIHDFFFMKGHYWIKMSAWLSEFINHRI